MGRVSRAVAFRCQAKAPPGRGAGTSAVQAAAYNARDNLLNETTGERADFRRGHSACTFSGIFAPPDAPDWLKVTKDTSREELSRIRARLWNEVERVEHRANSQFARSLEINLPHQLNQEQREQVVKDWVKANFTRQGMIADVNLHAPHNDGDVRNHHAHILLTLRRLDHSGWAEHKERDWNSRTLFQEWKVDLAARCADRLGREGFTVEAERWRHGYMTLPRQRAMALERGDLEYAEACNRKPERHLGPNIKQMEKRGMNSYVEENRAQEAAREEAAQRELDKLRDELAAVERQQEVLARELRRENAARHEQEVHEQKARAGEDALHIAAFEKERVNRSVAEDKVPVVRIAGPDKPLYAVVGDIRIAYQLSDSAGQFREALAERGHYLVRADEGDVQHALAEHIKAAADAKYRPALDLGEYAVVDPRGRVFTLSKTATGDSRAEVAAFLVQLDGEDVPGVATIREQIAAERGLHILIAGRDQVTHTASRHVEDRDTMLDMAATALDYAATGVEKVLDIGAASVEAGLEVADGFIAASRPTREQAFAKINRRHNDVAHARIDFARYQNDEEYRRRLIRDEALEAEHRRQERYYEQQKAREGGRD